MTISSSQNPISLLMALDVKTNWKVVADENPLVGAGTSGEVAP